MIAGLEEITEGELSIAGRVVNHVDPAERDIAMVFQNYALYPHMTVYNNMAYGLRNRGMAKAEIDAAVSTAATNAQSDGNTWRAARASCRAGQRQRVAMGRAIVRNPALFLFDEPLSNLDAKLRGQMRIEIKALQRRLGVTSVYVTHDQVEAMTMADRIHRPQWRAHRADRHAGRGLSPARQHLCRQLHGRAADEPSARALQRQRPGGISPRQFTSRPRCPPIIPARSSLASGRKMSGSSMPRIPMRCASISNSSRSSAPDGCSTASSATAGLIVHIPHTDPIPGGDVYVGLPKSALVMFNHETGMRL